MPFGRSEQYLLGRPLLLPGFRNGRDERGLAARLEDPLGRLPLRIQFPVEGRGTVWRIENRLREESIRHSVPAGGSLLFRIPFCRNRASSEQKKQARIPD